MCSLAAIVSYSYGKIQNFRSGDKAPAVLDLNVSYNNGIPQGS